MRKTGTVVRWQDDKGFGFIAPANGGPSAFLHIKSLPPGPRPAVGASVRYREVRDAQGRLRAESVELTGGLDVGLDAGPATRAFLVAVASLGGIAVLATAGILPRVLAWLYPGASLVTFLLYLLDKRAARQGDWRTSESTLHFWALIGGWPGALWAQQLLRHKSSKREFRHLFWLTVTLNLAALGYLATDHGAPLATWLDQAGYGIASTVTALPWREWAGTHFPAH